jgi:steroid 5-alpha reductase family enzyme
VVATDSRRLIADQQLPQVTVTPCINDQMAEYSSCKLSFLISKSLEEPGSPISRACLFCMFFICWTYLTSILTGNYSQVDKLWSITPVVYAWIFVDHHHNDATRTLLMAILVTIWGLRLTYNFNRRGGYQWPPWKGDEDYRWAYLQKGFFIPALKNRIVWHVFNFIFISVYQNILLFLMVAPASMVANLVALNPNDCFVPPSSSTTHLGLNIWDAMATLLFLGFWMLEAIADNQQYAFQTEKYRRKKAGEPLENDFAHGYCQSGVYSYMRKPNYTGEQGMWCIYYLFSVAALWSLEGIRAIDCFFNCTLLGPVLLLFLFQGSGDMTEQITISKYPSYTTYQERVPRYLPKFFSSKSWQKEKKKSQTYS